MPIDPSIPLQVRFPQVDSPMESYGKILSLRHMLLQGQRGAEELKQTRLENQAKQRDIEEEAAFMAKLKSGAKDEELIRASPKRAEALLKNRADQRRAALDDKVKKLETWAKLVNWVPEKFDPAQAEQHGLMLRGAVSMGLDLGALKPEEAQKVLAVGWTEPLQRELYQVKNSLLTLQQKHAQELADAKAAQEKAAHEAALPGIRAKTATEQLDLAARIVPTDQAGYDQWRADLPADIQARTPAKFSPAAVQAVQRMGMTPAQVQQAKPNTPTELATAMVDPTKTPEERAALEKAFKILERHAVASRPVINQFTGPAPGTPGAAPGPATIDQVPKRMRGMVKAITEYRAAMPAMGRNNPFSQELAFWVNKVNPTYEAGAAPARIKTQAEYSPGGKQGQNITSLNTALVHLGGLYETAQGLDNTPLRKWNTFANYLSRETGRPEVGQFKTDRAAVVMEIGRAVKGGVADVADEKLWMDTIDGSDSWESLRGNIRRIGDIIKKRLTEQQAAYEGIMHGPPENFGLGPFVREKAAKVLEKISAGGGASGLRVGEVRKGYRYKGGDPSQQQNWEKVK